MKKLNSISLMFPVYKDSGTIKKMIHQSLKVLREVSRKFEIIIVDDGCPDQTGIIAKKINFNKKLFLNLEGVLFPAGEMYSEDYMDLEYKKINDLISSNFSSISYLITNYIKNKKKGLIVGYGSVSAQLGREINPYYSASKRALDSFFESLAFQCSNKNYNIQFYVLGYLKTNLSFGKKLFLPRGSTIKLSKLVYKNRFLKNKKIYFPSWWGIIIFFIKLLPLKFLILFNNFLNK